MTKYNMSYIIISALTTTINPAVVMDTMSGVFNFIRCSVKRLICRIHLMLSLSEVVVGTIEGCSLDIKDVYGCI